MVFACYLLKVLLQHFSKKRNLGFFYNFCLMMEESVSRSGSGSVQIMTDPDPQHCAAHCLLSFCSKKVCFLQDSGNFHQIGVYCVYYFAGSLPWRMRRRWVGRTSSSTWHSLLTCLAISGEFSCPLCLLDRFSYRNVSDLNLLGFSVPDL
jgi:hypothetical protein